MNEYPLPVIIVTYNAWLWCSLVNTTHAPLGSHSFTIKTINGVIYIFIYAETQGSKQQINVVKK